MVVTGLVMIAVAVVAMTRAYRNSPRQAQPTPVEADGAAAIERDDGDEPAPRTLRPWILRDIEVDEAMAWINHGFDADHAYLLRSMGVDPRTAARLRDAGLSDSALLSLVEEASFRHHTGLGDLVVLAERAPQLAPQAVGWLSLGVDVERALAYVAAGFTAAASAAWRDAGWAMDDALPWFAAKFEPASASAWRANGFDPAEAHGWRREHFGVKQAVQWRRLGDTPTRARDVEKRFGVAGVTVTDGLRWLDRGFSVDEVCAGPTMDAQRESRLRPIAADAGERGAVNDRLAYAFSGVPITRDDLLSAAGQLACAGGSPEILYRLQVAAAAVAPGGPKEVSAELIDELLVELRRLDDIGALGAPHTARALVRRMARALDACALITDRPERAEATRS